MYTCSKKVDNSTFTGDTVACPNCEITTLVSSLKTKFVCQLLLKINDQLATYTVSAIEATKFLLKEGMEFVLTERFCQDPIEEYLEPAKTDNPDIRAFGYNNNTIRIQKSVSCQSGNTRRRRDKRRSWDQVTHDPLPSQKRLKLH